MAKLVKINASLGMTLEVKNVWLKPNISLQFDLEEEDSKPENRERIIERAFEVLEEEIDKELVRLGIEKN